MASGRVNAVHCHPTLWIAVAVVVLAVLAPSRAYSDEGFSDDAQGGKHHLASGFACPAKIATFERDAVGKRDPEAGSVYCAYSKLDGVYGTVVLKPLKGAYDPRSSLSGAFEEAQSTGGHMIGEETMTLASHRATLGVYTRTYETAKLLEAHYRVLYTGAQVGNWAVELTIEYADPRDTDAQKEFLSATYNAASAEIAAAAPSSDAAARH